MTEKNDGKPMDIINILDNRGDDRGESYTLPDRVLEFLGPIQDTHFATFDGGATRGNHFHRYKREVLVLFHDGPWVFAWAQEKGSEPYYHHFDGKGAVALEIEIGAVHAIKNLSEVPLRMTGLCNQPYDPDTPDSFPHTILD